MDPLADRMGRLPDFHSEVRDLRADRLSMAVGTPEENGARQEVRELVQRRRSCFARPRREMLLFVDVVEFREVPVPRRFWAHDRSLQEHCAGDLGVRPVHRCRRGYLNACVWSGREEGS